MIPQRRSRPFLLSFGRLAGWFRAATLVVAAGLVLAVEPHLWPPMTVPAIAVEKGPVLAVRRNLFPGGLDADRRLQLGPDVGGRVARVSVKPGDWVERGSVLMTVDSAATRRHLASRRQVLADAREAQRDQCAAAVLAAERVEEARALVELGLRGALSIGMALDHQEDADRACDAAAGWVDWAEVAMAQAREDVAGTTLRAPFDAIVARVDTAAGAVVDRRQVVIELMHRSTLFVTAPFDAVEAGHLPVGAAVQLTGPGSGPVRGTLRRTRPSVDEGEGGAVVVDIDFDGTVPRAWGLPGARIDAAVTVVREATARIPVAALMDEGTVLVVRHGRVMRVPVQVGLAGEAFLEATAGVRAGDLVVVSPLWPLLKPGMRVRPANLPRPSARF